MFGKYNITVTPNSRISLLYYSYCKNNMCHAHVMLHNESVNKNMKKFSCISNKNLHVIVLLYRKH